MNNLSNTAQLVLFLASVGILKLVYGTNAECNHDGLAPIDYCLESHIDEFSTKSLSLKCRFDEINNIWHVDELEYPYSSKCQGEYVIINSEECKLDDNCVCGESTNDCYDPNHQVIFNLVNGERNIETGLCEYDNEMDSFTQFIYDGSVGADCGVNEYIERTDTCQRIYCNADNLLLIDINNDEQRRRLFLPIVIVPAITITASTWAAFCNDNPKHSIC